MFYYSKTPPFEVLGESSSPLFLDVFQVWISDTCFVIFNGFRPPFGLKFSKFPMILTFDFKTSKM